MTTPHSSLATHALSEAETVARFNAAFARPGLPPVLCPVDSETLETLAKICGYRGRPDLATELRALIYRRHVPVDDL
jgi:hypothetical protein